MTGSRSEHHLQNDNFILFVMSLSLFVWWHLAIGEIITLIYAHSMLVLLHSATVLFCLALSVFCRGWLNSKCYTPITLSELLLQPWPAEMPVCVVTVTAFPPLSTTKRDALVQIKRNTEKYHLTRTTATIWGFRKKKICESMFFITCILDFTKAK